MAVLVDLVIQIDIDAYRRILVFMEVPFGSRAKLRELKVLAGFRDRESMTISDLMHIVKNIDDKYEIEPAAAITAAVIDLKRYGLIKEVKDRELFAQKKYELTEEGRQYLQEHEECRLPNIFVV